MSPLRAARLLIRLSARRRLNMIVSAFRRRRGGEGAPGKRAATPGKGGWGGAAFAVFLAVCMLFSFGSMAWQAVENLERALGSVEKENPLGGVFYAEETGPGRTTLHREPDPEGRWHRVEEVAAPRREPLPIPEGLRLHPDVSRGAALVVALNLAALVLFTLGSANQELSRPEWDLEWLATLPISRGALLGVRVIERTIVNPFGWIVLFPFLGALAYKAGDGVAAAAVSGAALALPLLFLVALARTLVETWLRMRFAPAALRNLQALVTIAAIVVFYLALSVATGAGAGRDYFLFRWARALPEAALALPGGLAALAVARAEPGAAAAAAGGLALWALGAAAAGFPLLGRLLRDGVVATGARESGGRAVAATRRHVGTSAPPAGRFALAPIQRKDVLLLSRDRNFLIQTLVVPALIIGAQVIFNPKMLEGALSKPEHLGALAFGLAAYGLMFSALQAINTEGPALWMLYCAPVPLERQVLLKAALWGSIALVLPACVMAAGFVYRRKVGLDGLGAAALVLGGVAIYASIAASLGVFAARPLEPDPQRRARISYLYLYMLLAGLYSYALYAPNLAQRLSLVVLTALLALALWQKARDRFPYLLDPTASPPARVSLADGLIAAQMFFVIQGLALAATLAAADAPLDATTPPLGALLFAFVLAGAVVFAAVRLTYWRAGVEGVPRILPPAARPGRFSPLGAARALGLGGAAGALAAAAGLGYLAALRWAEIEIPGASAAGLSERGRLWIGLLAVAAAPVFEEFIFRGLIFGGLRRSFGILPSAVASAAVFAICHPPLSMAPVFVLGLAAALAYERSGALLGPIAAHAIYNAAVVGAQLLAR